MRWRYRARVRAGRSQVGVARGVVWTIDLCIDYSRESGAQSPSAQRQRTKGVERLDRNRCVHVKDVKCP